MLFQSFRPAGPRPFGGRGGLYSGSEMSNPSTSTSDAVRLVIRILLHKKRLFMRRMQRGGRYTSREREPRGGDTPWGLPSSSEKICQIKKFFFFFSAKGCPVITGLWS